ncbi:MAG: ATP-binding cassette domain-containing protein, partial [Lachnospiraceae bacterium]|nr:ATP-binding cassette domain-containing protein [Lachnospiraceae bacterium]
MIRMEHVTKKFDDILALDQVSAQINENCIFGLVGTNGAGKSTLLRVASGVLKPEKGRVMVDEQDVWENPQAKEKICFLADTAWFFPNATAEVMRDYYRVVYPRFDTERFDDLLRKFDLDPRRKLAAFSKGMKKQV